MADEKDDDDLEPPAVKNFNEGIYTAKHIATKTVKGTAIGALTGAAAFGVGSLIFHGALVAALGPLGAVGAAVASVTGHLGPMIGAVVLPAAGAGAVAGAIGGAGVGGVMGISSAEDAVRDKKDELREQAERGEMRRERLAALHMQRDQQARALELQGQQMGLRPPGHGLPNKSVDGPGLA